MLIALLLLSISVGLEAKLESIIEEKSRTNLRHDMPQIIGNLKLDVNLQYEKKQSSSLLEQLKKHKNKGNYQSGKEIRGMNKTDIEKQLAASNPQLKNVKNGIAEMGLQTNGWSQPKIMKPVSKQQIKPYGLLSKSKMREKITSLSKQIGQVYIPMKKEARSRDMETNQMKNSAISLNLPFTTFNNPEVAQRSYSFSVSQEHKHKQIKGTSSLQNLQTCLSEAKDSGLKSKVQRKVSVAKLNERLYHLRAKRSCNINNPKKELWKNPPAPGMYSQGLLREQHIIKDIIQRIAQLLRIEVSEKKEMIEKKETFQDLVIRVEKCDFTIGRFKEIYSERLAELSQAIGIKQNFCIAVEIGAKIGSLKQEIQTLLRHIQENIDNFKSSQSYEPSSTLQSNLRQIKIEDNQQKKPSDSAISWIKMVKRSFLSDSFSQETEPQFFEKIKQLKNEVIKIIQDTHPVYRRLIGMPNIGEKLYGNLQIQRMKKLVISGQQKVKTLKPMCKYYVKNQLPDVMKFMQSAEVSLEKCLLKIKVAEIFLDLELQKEQMKKKGKKKSLV